MATWTYAVSDSYAEQVGDQGIGKLVDVLTQGANIAPGHNVDEIQDVLLQAAQDVGLNIAKPELHAMAGNLSLHDLELVRVTDDSGTELAQIPVANQVAGLPAEERSDNVHLEPQDPRRPSIS